MTVSDEGLDYVAKTNVTKKVSEQIDGDTRAGRGRSDVIRDALDFYFEYRNRIIAERSVGYGKKKQRTRV